MFKQHQKNQAKHTMHRYCVKENVVSTLNKYVAVKTYMYAHTVGMK